MDVYFFTAGIEPDQVPGLVRSLGAKIPALKTLNQIDEIVAVVGRDQTNSNKGKSCIIFPVNAPSFERLISIAEQYAKHIFFVFLSDEISASDYKRLVRTGSADWIGTRTASEEILEVLSRIERNAHPSTPIANASRPVVATFIPSGGGVGTATLAVETGVQLKSHKRSRQRKICLFDLDFQASHICDYLDIEPRLQIGEILAKPERLDDQLLDLYITSHTSGLDVLAAPRNRDQFLDVTLEALDVLFGMLARRYDLILLDLPPISFGWTGHILSASDLALVCGVNTIPGLRKISETLQFLRKLTSPPSEIAVVLNRCERRLLRGFARRQHVRNLLRDERVFYIRENAPAARQGVNTGIPMSISGSAPGFIKDIGRVTELVTALQARKAPAA